MRYSILSFNQEKLLQYKLSMNEVLLLQYIYEVQASPKMHHEVKNNTTCTWLDHKKIHEDLPILDVSETQLKRYLKHLVDCNLIVRTQISNDLLRGTKSYYGITETCEQLRYDADQVSKMTLENDQVSKMSCETTRPSIKNELSDSKLLEDSKLNKSISKDIDTNFSFGTKKSTVKSKKPSMYDKCVSVINDFTDDEILRNMLVESFKLFLANNKESDTPFYSNTFKGKLNKLKKLSDDNYTQRKIVQQTLDNGWNNFYELKTDSRKKIGNIHDRINESGVLNVPHSNKRKENIDGYKKF